MGNHVRSGNQTLVAYQLVLLALQATFSISKGDCWEYDPITGLRGCIHNGHFIPLASSLQIDCMNCLCSKFGSLLCCRIGGALRVPETCIVVYDGCYPKAVLRSDPKQPCDGPVSFHG